MLKKKNRYNSYFLLGVVFLYMILFLFNAAETTAALKSSITIFIKVAPVFILVIIFMGLINHYLDKKTVSRYLGEKSGIKGWLLAALAGLLSHGPIYAWFPLMEEMREKGMKYSLIAVFFYNRAIKIPMLPVMVFYFGLPFVMVFTIWMMFASFIQGKLIDLIV